MNREEKIAHLQALEERKRRARDAPLLQRFFALTGPQHEATTALRAPGSRGLIFGGGNRAGKSTLLAALVHAYAAGYWIWEVPDLELTPDGALPPRSAIPPKYWIYREDGLPFACPSRILVLSGLPFQRGIGTILWPKIDDFCTPHERRHRTVHKGQFGVPMQLTFANGTRVIFGSGDQSTMAFEGIDLDACLNDEPIPRGFWAPIWRGLTDRHGQVIFTMTPIGANAPWIHQELVPRDDFRVVEGSIWSNPHIPHRSKEEFLAGLAVSEDELASREKGTFTIQSMLAFPTFDEEAHVVPSRGPPPGWTRVCICDPAHRRPFFFIWLAKGPRGQVEVYDEWPRGVDYMMIRSSDKTIGQYATLVRDTERGDVADFRALDPRFGKAEFRLKGQKQTSIQSDFADEGLEFTCDIPDTEREETGIQRMRNMLAWDSHAPISEHNVPQLRVQEHCTNVIAMFKKSTFVPANARDPSILPEGLAEAYKDPRDCVRYGILLPTPRDLRGGNYLQADYNPQDDDYEL